ncbi:restriction endonuclease subunit S [Tateyamaria omphalii]|uniref:restriction endonuclease subunit S n=1 Tax=Tateyamaria omphalii TaxID=299262 RepID=UPI001C99562A|nr:restriction endonuclease subunit S [Tateyamaria omphalii]MBY5933733.1 restriction endonuclease subunit S [Tateyamaria omphalii]
MSMVPIGEIASVKGGGTPSKRNPEFYEGNIPWVTPKDMKVWEISDSIDKITQEAIDGSATNLVPERSVLLVNRSGILKHTLPVGITRRAVAINQDLKALVCSEQAHPEYVAHIVKAAEPIVLKWVRATTADNFPIESLKELKIPFPSLEEQRRIAGILDQADAIRRLRTRALDKLNSLGHAIFHEMFGDPATNPMNWDIMTLPDLGKLDRGVSKHRPRNDPDLLGGDYPLIQTGDVARAGDYIQKHSSTYSDLGLAQSRMWPKGTVCVTIAANIADTAILDFDACFPDSVVGFDSSHEATNFFVHRWFATVKGRLEKIAPAVAQKNINLGILKGLPIIKPPRDLIEVYFDKERSITEQAKHFSAQEEASTQLFASLQHRAFRGEL